MEPITIYLLLFSLSLAFLKQDIREGKDEPFPWDKNENSKEV